MRLRYLAIALLLVFALSACDRLACLENAFNPVRGNIQTCPIQR
jgi:hypothetical protein